MTDRRRIKYEVDMDSADFQRGASGLRGALQNLSDRFVITAGEAIDFAKKLGQTAIDFSRLGDQVNRTSKSFDEVYGPAAERLLTSLEETRRSMGLSKTEFEALTIPIGLMATNAGYGADAAGRLSGELVTLAGDVAAFNPTVGSASDALSNMQAALRGEFDPLEKWGSKLSAARVQAEEARLRGIDPANQALSDQQLYIKAVVGLIESDLAPAMGTLADAEGTASDSTNEMNSRLKDMWESLAGRFGPGYGAAINALADMTEAEGKAAEEGGALNGLMTTLGDAFRLLTQPSYVFTDSLGEMADRLEAVRLAGDHTKRTFNGMFDVTPVDEAKQKLEELKQKQDEYRQSIIDTYDEYDNQGAKFEALMNKIHTILYGTTQWPSIDIPISVTGGYSPAAGGWVGPGNPDYETGRQQAQKNADWSFINGEPK